jgi:Papain family cysteine protease
VEAGLIAAARRSAAQEDDLGVDAAEAEGILDAREPPAALDLREGWHDVADQGRTNSCVGWALADSVLRWQLVKAGRLAPAEKLSARFLWMASKEFDQRIDYPSTFLDEDGTSLKAGLDVARKYGLALETELPWDRGFATGSPEAFYASAGARRISRYFNLGDDTVDRHGCFGAWRRWMHQRGPVLVLLAIDRQLGAPGPLLSGFDRASVQHSHAAALVAYTPERFVVRSSWGTGWGDGGYAEMDLDYAAEAIIESYGVVI